MGEVWGRWKKVRRSRVGKGGKEEKGEGPGGIRKPEEEKNEKCTWKAPRERG